ncbi:Hpt domain-containing protein [Pseudomonas sp. MWU349]|uniref:Hpt domain-containing protein n=1 Tax=Pseudomonas sp. MWU349 TaxID=2802572 RepID=UPI001FF0CF97|nr:Hpt domain-containing protein [Pseudomonas sp. MWU349]
MCDEEARCQACGMDAWLVKPVPLQPRRELFARTMGQDVEHLRQALDGEDYERIFQLLHRVRGSLAVAGQQALILQVHDLGQSLRQSGLTATTRAHSLMLLHALQDISQLE